MIKITKLLLLSILILTLIKLISTSISRVGNEAEITLQKCSSKLVNNFIEIPKSLQAPYTSQIVKKLENFRRQSGAIDQFYNFSLTQPNDNCRMAGSELEDLKLPEITLQIQNEYKKNVPKAKRNISAFVLAKTKYYFTVYGFLKSTRNVFHPENYCIFNITDTEIGVKVCTSNDTVTKTPSIIPKCCPIGMVLSVDLSPSTADSPLCTAIAGHDWEPVVHKVTGESTVNTNISFSPFSMASPIQPNYEYRSPSGKSCKKIAPWSLYLNNSKDIEFKMIKVLENGQVFTKSSDNHEWQKQTGNFCMDGFHDANFKGPHSYSEENFRKNSLNQIILVCEKDNGGKEYGGSSRIYSKIYFAGSCVSCFFLLIIVIVYGLIWFESNVHTWTIGIFSLCMLLNNLFVALGHAYGLWKRGSVGTGKCVAIAIMAHFFYIALFSWMTVLTFDLWSTITSLIPQSRQSKGKLKFVTYTSFGFGIPLLVVSISLIIEHQFDVDDQVVRPLYGVFMCHLDKSAVFHHAIIVNLILFAINLIFGILTLKFLIDYKRGKMGKIKSTQKSSQEIHLFGKLFVVVGFSWIFELVSSIAGNDDPEKGIGWYWALFDMYNMLQAILLCWIFVVKKDIKEQLTKKFKIFQKMFPQHSRSVAMSSSVTHETVAPVQLNEFSSVPLEYPNDKPEHNNTIQTFK